jgi:hypothetical protein
LASLLGRELAGGALRGLGGRMKRKIEQMLSLNEPELDHPRLEITREGGSVVEMGPRALVDRESHPEVGRRRRVFENGATECHFVPLPETLSKARKSCARFQLRRARRLSSGANPEWKPDHRFWIRIWPPPGAWRVAGDARRGLRAKWVGGVTLSGAKIYSRHGASQSPSALVIG